jgi:uncharacterized surface protein with fasciclin (FAS1) repeats
MSTLNRFGTIAVSVTQPIQLQGEIETPSNRYDDTTGANSVVQVSVKGTKESYEIYPWGKNNRLPNEKITLLRSNGEAGNLISTRVDFLYGSGLCVFVPSGGGLEQVNTAPIKQYMLENNIRSLVDGLLTHLVECGTAFDNITKDGAHYRVSNALDPLTVRCVKLKGKEYKKAKYALNGDWINKKDENTSIIDAFQFGGQAPDESIYQLHRPQTGQFYYSYPTWWGATKWIELSNRIPNFHIKGLDNEYNVAYICRIAEQYFERMFELEGITTDQEKDVYRDLFYDMIDNLISNSEGGRRVIYDECPVNPTTGKLEGWIDLIPIKRSITGDEYTKLYSSAIMAFSNASGLLPGLAGVSDGKMLGGSGSELRVTAEFQQFYRTPRERQLLLDLFNAIEMPRMRAALNLPEDAEFGFQNVLLETLNKEKTGSKELPTSGTQTGKASEKTPTKTAV